ncbi:MAG: M28 family peptidase [Bacteroidetes bacterium]|nr:M28 family peptidase [Bacteroidota bacterium]
MRIFVVGIGLLISFTGFAQLKTAVSDTTRNFSEARLKAHLEVLTSDSLEGRCTATEGQKKAAAYISSFMEEYHLLQVVKDSNGNASWFQSWPFAKRFGDPKKYLPYSENVIGLLPASVPNNEYIVISGHYDHLGIIRDTIYNGADDNGTGTASLLELIRLLSMDSIRPRNILFIFFSGEEKGLLGSKYYSEHPVIPLEELYCDINIDMIGRADSAHMADSNYIYVIGSDRISNDLDQLLRNANARGDSLFLDYTFNDPEDPQRLYERSDHYNFAKHDIPVVFFFSGLHPDYHSFSDDMEKINLGILYKRMMLAYRLTKELLVHPGNLQRN